MKKLSKLLLAGVLAVGLAGCASQSEAPPAPTPEQQRTSQMDVLMAENGYTSLEIRIEQDTDVQPASAPSTTKPTPKKPTATKAPTTTSKPKPKAPTVDKREIVAVVGNIPGCSRVIIERDWDGTSFEIDSVEYRHDDPDRPSNLAPEVTRVPWPVKDLKDVPHAKLVEDMRRDPSTAPTCFTP